jgi:hypothetical protein
MRTPSAVTLPVVVITAFASGILIAKTPFSTPAAAAVPAQARFDHVMPVGMTLQVAVLLDKNTGDIWYYDLDKPAEVGYAGTIQELGRPLTRRAGAPGASIPSDSREAAHIAAMKSDLRNLVTAEEAFFADSVKYTARIGRGGLQFNVTVGNSLPLIRLTTDGWVATIRNLNSTTVCAIFVGSTAQPPATREGEPKCQ